MSSFDSDNYYTNNDPKSAGRWTNEEHVLFLQGLQLYNKQWKLIADLVKTRTVVQIRTHAQKYFLKLQKSNKPMSDKNYAMLANILRSDSIDSTYPNDLVPSTGTTTSEGESDNERAVSITSETERDRSNSMSLPKLLLTRSDGDLKSKSDSPRKRSRDKGTPKAKSSTAKSPKRTNASRSVSFSALNSLSTMSREVELLYEEDLGLSMEKFYEYLPYEDDGSTEDDFFDRVEWHRHNSMDEDSDSRSQSPYSRSMSNSNGVPPVFPGLTTIGSGLLSEPSRDRTMSHNSSSLLSENTTTTTTYPRPNLSLTIGGTAINHLSSSAASGALSLQQPSHLQMKPSSSSNNNDIFTHPLSTDFNLTIPPPTSPTKSPRKRGRPKKLFPESGIAMEVSESQPLASDPDLTNSEATTPIEQHQQQPPLTLTLHVPSPPKSTTTVESTVTTSSSTTNTELPLLMSVPTQEFSARPHLPSDGSMDLSLPSNPSNDWSNNASESMKLHPVSEGMIPPSVEAKAFNYEALSQN